MAVNDAIDIRQNADELIPRVHRGIAGGAAAKKVNPVGLFDQADRFFEIRIIDVFKGVVEIEYGVVVGCPADSLYGVVRLDFV